MSGFGTTPQNAYDSYLKRCRAFDYSPSKWDECSFFKAEQISVEVKGIPIITNQIIEKGVANETRS
jgi:hypothetical protein